MISLIQEVTVHSEKKKKRIIHFLRILPIHNGKKHPRMAVLWGRVEREHPTAASWSFFSACLGLIWYLSHSNSIVVLECLIPLICHMTWNRLMQNGTERKPNQAKPKTIYKRYWRKPLRESREAPVHHWKAQGCRHLYTNLLSTLEERLSCTVYPEWETLWK